MKLQRFFFLSLIFQSSSNVPLRLRLLQKVKFGTGRYHCPTPDLTQGVGFSRYHTERFSGQWSGRGKALEIYPWGRGNWAACFCGQISRRLTLEVGFCGSGNAQKNEAIPEARFQLRAPQLDPRKHRFSRWFLRTSTSPSDPLRHLWGQNVLYHNTVLRHNLSGTKAMMGNTPSAIAWMKQSHQTVLVCVAIDFITPTHSG